MKNFIMTLISTLIVFSCTVNVSQKDIPYTSAKKYFVKNTSHQKDLTEKIITSQEEFDQIFGAATTMGMSGKPTPIDFSKENVLALIYPKTNLEVEFIPVSLQEKGQDIVYSYKVIKGGQRSFMTIPNTIIIIQKPDSKKKNFQKVQK
ncbi:hypothetical protein [Chryseobacterium sp. AG844]|uniref:hypothetical protein n=1 Tax=Chryseobacterium sp. AG844 TaxID=2183998 RepID=UPI000D7120DF|nr:hypothetical protein [Chryseobacterium sp. AG844]PWW17657.1 hypothetical protein DEU40_1222 [Chryseobacterium sp. AG844]